MKSKLLFNIYLEIWQRIPAKWQNYFSEKLKTINLKTNTLYPKPPSAAIIDPTNICNLDCPLCASKKQNYDKTKMSFEKFCEYLDKIPSLKVIILFNWGEPFLNLDIFKIIKEAVSRNIYTIIHSNFSFNKDNNFFEQILESGLHQLVISADGATQESYDKYRVNGNFDYVFENMKKLSELKRKMKKRDPKIIWKYLVNRYNENEIDYAKQLAKNIGVEIIFESMGLADDLPDIELDYTLQERKEKWLPKNQNYILDYYKRGEKDPINDTPCYQLFSSIVINPDGKITPCCWISNKENVWGDLNKQEFEEIWNGENYLYSRSLFVNQEYKGNINFNICTKCNIFKRIK